MNTTGTHIPATIAAIVIMLAATTTTAFHSVTVFATPLSSSEQAGSTNATTAATTPETTGQEQSTIYIVKDGTNSYTISGTSSSVGSFDTTYRIAGERSAIRSAENLIISTITDDFKASPTIGYVMVGNASTTTASTTTGATLPNPFATPEQITERITSELRRVITEAESSTSQGQNVEIECDFGMSLEDMRCHYGPIPA